MLQHLYMQELQYINFQFDYLCRDNLRLVFSIQNLNRLVTSFLWLQNSIDQAV